MVAFTLEIQEDPETKLLRVQVPRRAAVQPTDLEQAFAQAVAGALRVLVQELAAAQGETLSDEALASRVRGALHQSFGEL